MAGRVFLLRKSVNKSLTCCLGDGLNLTASDLPKSYFLVGPRTRLPQYPFEMVRALTVAWLFTG
jgi:hypothetical protein